MFRVKSKLQIDSFNYPLYKLIKQLRDYLDKSNELFDAFLYDFQDIIVSRNLVPKVWNEKYETLDAIKEKTKELLDLIIIPINSEKQLDSLLGEQEDQILTIAAVSTLLLFNPYQEADNYDVTSWLLHGTVNTQLVQEIGPVVLELACHAKLVKEMENLRAFAYYKVMLDALKKALQSATWQGNEIFVSWTVFSLVVLALKFKDNLVIIQDYPYIIEYVSLIATSMMGFVPDITEAQLSDIFIKAVNDISNLAIAVTNVLNVNFAVIHDIVNGNATPMIPSFDDARYLIDDDGNTYTAENFAPANHEHSEYLKKGQPAADASFLVDASGNFYTLSYFAKEDHTHSGFVLKTEIKDADYLWTPTKLYTASDFAERNHTHENYLTLGQPAYAAKAFLAEILSGKKLSPLLHEHPELLKPGDVAESTLKLGGKLATDFAEAGHTHKEFITVTQASAIGEKKSTPLNPFKGAKGVYAVFDEPGTQKDTLKAVHFIFGQTAFSSSSTIIYAPNIVYAHCTLIGSNSSVALPIANYIYDENNPERIIGVQFVNPRPSGSLVQIMYMIAYQPDVTKWFKKDMIPPEVDYE